MLGQYPRPLRYVQFISLLNSNNVEGQTINVLIFRLSTRNLRNYPGVDYEYTITKYVLGAYILYITLVYVLFYTSSDI